MLEKDIRQCIARYQDPDLESDYVSANVLKQIILQDNHLKINLEIGFPQQTVEAEKVAVLKDLLKDFFPAQAIEISIESHIQAHTAKLGLPTVPQVKNLIAIASGKGGVGKSTIAINLALALAREGARVGIVDADIYGPSQPTMLGAQEEQPVIKDRRIQPIIRYGLQSMSIGFLVDPEAAMMWRGPMLGKALEQLIFDTDWQNLDYLVIDLPPGTGDVQLTLCQKMPLTGAIMVTTPQDLALLDVRRAAEMFKKLNIPILGVVENMSHYHCPTCGHAENIFGEGGAAKLQQEYQTPLLGQIPLDKKIRELTDKGCPPVVENFASPYAKKFLAIARRVAAMISLQAKNYSHKFPKIVLENHTAAKSCKHKE